MVEDLLGGLVESRHGRVGCGHGVLALPRLHRVVMLSVVVGVEELLKPLDELKVVLELSLHQLVYWNDLEEEGEQRIRTRSVPRTLVRFIIRRNRMFGLASRLVALLSS